MLTTRPKRRTTTAPKAAPREAATRTTVAAGRARQRSFADRVYDAVRAIPAGRVSTYGDVAAAAGRPGAARAVGTLMAKGGPRAVPAHRVVAAGGALGGYGGHESTKAALLRAEGLVVVGRRIRNFIAVRWMAR
jgi:methylated-DNA-[protein]-cysteine S-methyltransferase